MGASDKLLAGLIRTLPALIGLLAFFGTAYVLYFLTFSSTLPQTQILFLAILIAVSVIRLIAMVSGLIFSPAAPSLRLLPVNNPSATLIHRLIVWSFGYIVVAIQVAVVLHYLHAGRDTTTLILILFVTLLLVAAAIAVAVHRNAIRAHILSQAEDSGGAPGWWRQQFASLSPILILLYLGVLWLLLINDVIDTQTRKSGAFLVSFFVVPIWMVADRLIQWLVRHGMSALKIHQPEYRDDRPVPEDVRLQREKGEALYRKVNASARIALVLVLAIWLAGLWNLHIPLVSEFTAVVFDGLIILTLALFFWKFVSGWIERKIQESDPEPEEKDEEEGDEWGGAAQRGRSYTLLPIVRKFIGTVLVVMVTLTLLSSMGVDIGPLLAGAGVVGLALGFGAQKLVADVFSGFFYLLDDAFRVGEYVTAGSVSGTVEGISLRNVMLRHHRGMLQIIPHSELGAITNYMRGGIIVKFNLEFPYDADIDKIRKVIKKVGKAMLEDEELGKDFIKPVKSQGVREIANSVMVIRVKFTANPGAHFVIRREAYKRITEALNKKGIYYAHRKVIVDIPPGLAVPENSAQGEFVAKGAGAAAEAADEVSKKGKPDGDNQRE